MAEAQASLKDDIAAAVAEYEEEEPNEEVTQATPEAKEEEVSAEPVEAAADEPAGEPEPVTAAEPEPAVAEEYKPPVAWSPTLKEDWKNLSEETRKGIAEYEHQREAQVNQVQRQSVEARRLSEQFINTVEPYRNIMSLEGAADPFQAIDGLMQQVMAMHMGTPQQKAQIIGNWVQRYGVDVEMLDQTLVGLQNGQQQVPAQPQPQQQLYDPRVDQMLAQQTNQVQVQADQTIAEFAADPANKWFPNVRHSMADEMDIARANGQQMSAQQAYDIACRKNPEIFELMVKDRINESLTNGGGMAGKRNAASSISGKRSAATTLANQDMSLRDTIATQFGDDERV